MFAIRPDDLTDPQTRALLALHLSGMHDHSPPDAVFALDLSSLQSPDIRLWSAWDGEHIAGVGALRLLDAERGEIKSMRTHPDYLRQGVGTALLLHVIDAAQANGLKHLSLETGRGTAFGPALALYRRHGFVDGGPFGAYRVNGFSQFLHLRL
ncbi:GNAT family N-acetyltransferase [Sphingobium limneticum]|uniref:GNAT family N-acetyltransferase n=1 Tax=Sphingobium limneticum TaxID=1007511 RepID=A0A5J5I311_9SPHN|nr:GNAT family N-acetyltransferase [Sphingobium limneticum]KAA9017480.1 GNAT family N-acetyltransferase [Sphingobium limneticum]KAA9030071.1 GNAT family N-acetyltransferase [Sphingobium limneticum]